MMKMPILIKTSHLTLLAALAVIAAGCAGKKEAAPSTELTAEAAKAGLHFNPNAAYGSLTDARDGQEYRTVEIGGLTWMAENLNYKTNRTRCYEKADSNCVKYGRLYEWSDAVKACPSGWRLPDTADWNNLINAIDDRDDLSKIMDGRNRAGRMLRARLGWKDTVNVTDGYGFSALPGGSRSATGYFYDAGENGWWWSATEFEGDGIHAPSEQFRGKYAYCHIITEVFESVGRRDAIMGNGYSVRCVK